MPKNKEVSVGKAKFFVGALVGALAGIIAGMLTSPKSGRQIRADLKSKAAELKKNASSKTSRK